MYTRYAQINDYDFKIIDILNGNEAGISSVSFIISGKFTYGNMKSEKGVHRLIRNSPFDADGDKREGYGTFYNKKEKYLKEIGKMIKQKALEFIIIQIVKFKKEILKKIN